MLKCVYDDYTDTIQRRNCCVEKKEQLALRHIYIHTHISSTSIFIPSVT